MRKLPPKLKVCVFSYSLAKKYTLANELPPFQTDGPKGPDFHLKNKTGQMKTHLQDSKHNALYVMKMRTYRFFEESELEDDDLLFLLSNVRI